MEIKDPRPPKTTQPTTSTILNRNKRLLRLRRRIEEELMKASILVKFRMERGGDNVSLTDGYGHAVEDD